jgi:SRSO17 transposase
MRSKTHDTSENGYNYVRGQLTMEDKRNYANIERRLKVGNEDGQQMQQFMSDSPWSGDET